ncbi:MAG: hypothetical protein R3E04_13560 [Sphingobium sp.]
MTRHFPPPSLDDAAHRSLLVEAARCWRNARDTGQSVQPCLYKILAFHNCEMLAPVFENGGAKLDHGGGGEVLLRAA